MVQEKAFSEKLDPYIRVSEEGKNALWPLVKYAELTIPGSDLVPEGITFMDIPGTGDSNKKRSEVWKQVTTFFLPPPPQSPPSPCNPPTWASLKLLIRVEGPPGVED